MPSIDPSTLSTYASIVLKHTSIKLEINWAKQIVSGLVRYHFGFSSTPPESIVLDSSYLDISKTSFNGNATKFSISPRVELGSALTVHLPEAQGSVAENVLDIEFSTTEKCTALQWMKPEQTAGKKVPYMFSQCQAIHARSLYPCFDTPSVKSTFDISISSDHPAVSSGNPVESTEPNVYKFYQHVPIPSYLLAIASGDLTSASIGPRSLVYSEPRDIDACQYEFEADTEKFIETAEKLVFPYEWKTYNVLVLPPSFPYGGMENPNITFATPTLISGDRQNVDVIAHELAHSWSGNLVTNCSWEHFWLNEGWTVYLERRIVGALHGEPARHFSAIIGWQSLEAAQTQFPEKYTKLIVDLQGQQDPDDAFSVVPYEKGSTFLLFLENLLGGKSAFDPFIPYYFGKFKGKSLDSFEFKETLYEFFKDKKELLDSVDWDSWFYKPGLPPKPDFDTSLADACFALADKWVSAASKGNFSNFNKQDIKDFSTNQLVVFLENVTSKLQKSTVDATNKLQMSKTLDSLYSVSTSRNAEVVSRWYALAVDAKDTDEYPRLATWLGTVGRMKFVRPGFRKLNAVDKSLALETFKKHEDFYHPICRAMVAKDLGVSS